MSDEIVISLTDEAKNLIFRRYKSLTTQGAIYLTATNRSKKKYALQHYRRKFLLFYDSVIYQKKYTQFPDKYRKVLDNHYKTYSQEIKCEEDVFNLNGIAAGLIRHYAVANIGWDKDDSAI